jgi:putative tryptophan/tyrosine transport system substrate-binding protein
LKKAMRRRDFINAIAGAAAVWPVAGRAQQPEPMRRIGVLMGPAESDPQAQSEMAAFRQGLQTHGWTGRNVRLAYRWANGEVNRMRTFARELVALKPDAILAVTTPVLAALVDETRTVPIVFVRVSDPLGFVDNFAKPSGNVTGFSNFQPSLAGKWVQLLKEIAPDVVRATIMFNPATTPNSGLDFLRFAEAAGPSAGMQISAARVNDAADIERVIASVAHEGKAGVINLPDVFLVVHRELTIELTARYRVPTVYQYRYFAATGGLISYGPDVLDQYTRAADYIGRILKGAKLYDLPVQNPTKYELVINLKTAEALGINVPPTILLRADEVIE